jgi:hypothetical protein
MKVGAISTKGRSTQNEIDLNLLLLLIESFLNHLPGQRWLVQPSLVVKRQLCFDSILGDQNRKTTYISALSS